LPGSGRSVHISHQLRLLSSGVGCGACGLWSQGRLARLSKPCPLLPTSSRQARDACRIRRGVVPQGQGSREGLHLQ
jgi:hypothetical protein